MDVFVVGSALQSFVVFLAVHLLMFVFFKERQILSWTKFVYVLVLAYNIYLMDAYAVIFNLLSCLMLVLLIAVYQVMMGRILSGNSINIKLIMLLDVKGGKTIDEITARYNDKNLLDHYLEQLRAVKKIQCDDQGLYSAVPQRKPIFLIGSLLQVFKDLVNICSK